MRGRRTALSGYDRSRGLVAVLGPVSVLVLVGIVGSLSFVDPALEDEFRGALVSVAIVVAPLRLRRATRASSRSGM